MDTRENISMQKHKFMLKLVQEFNFETNNDRLEIVDLHQPWVKGGSWGTNTYLKYGQNAAGKTGLYQTTRNITNAQTDPTVPTNPQGYKFIGWCTT